MIRTLGVPLALSVLGIASCGRFSDQSTSKDVRNGTTNAALDVNDVSILFEKTGNGAFYPSIDVRSVWPERPFNDLIAFAKDHNLNGIKFGQFIVPADYVAIVNEFISSPNAQLRDDQKRKDAKEIAAEIQRNNVQCTLRADGSKLCIDAAAQPSFFNHRIAIANIDNWRIVSMRMDLCAGAHSGEVDQCDVEFRLIAQPFGDFAPLPPVNGVTPPLATLPGQMGPHMFDVSAHLLYKVGRLNLETGNIVDGAGRIVTTASEIIADLQTVKSQSPISTNGKPLGVHPGLRAEARNGGSNLSRSMTQLVQKYTRFGSALTNVTSMHIAGPAIFDASIWVFFQGVIENGGWNPTPITGSNTIWSLRSKSVKGASGKMFPPPQMQNRRNSINAIFDYEQGQTLPPEIADLPAFFDNPGRFGDPSLTVNGRVAASVRNSDCISCHMTSTRAFEWGIKSMNSSGRAQASLYVPPVGTTAYLDPEVIQRIDYGLRNFGYFLPPPLVSPLTGSEEGLGIFNFVGPRVEKPVIMTRVATESAELVNLINSRFLHVTNPGLVCRGEDLPAALAKSSGDDVFSSASQSLIRRRTADHAAISDCLLFQAYKPSVSFATCSQLCQNAPIPPTPPPLPPSAPILRSGSYIPDNRDGGFFASEYQIDRIVINHDAPTIFVKSLRVSKHGDNGFVQLNFNCTADAFCREEGNSDRTLKILNESTISYRSGTSSTVMHLRVN